MAPKDEKKGIYHDIPPPSAKTMEVRDKLAMFLEFLWLVILLLPCVLLTVIRTFFPGQGKSLKEKVVLVTGAGRGLGRGLALGFAREGCKVAVADINLTNAENTAAEIIDHGGVAKAYFCNVVKVDDVRLLREAIVTDLGPVDILVNNAGLVYAQGLIEECNEADILAVMNVNLTSHFWTIREFIPSMKDRNSGHIVAIASVASWFGLPQGSAYVASKFGAFGLMEVVRAELESRANNNVKTTTVCPYFINTSAQYVNHWDMRFPPISIDRAVETTIGAVKRDEVCVCIPWYLQPLMAVGRCIPRYILEKAFEIFSFNIQPQTEEEMAKHPLKYVVSEMGKGDKHL